MRDVSDRKRAEERGRAAEAELRARERELESFFALSPDPLAIIGRDGTLRRVNPAAGAALGVPAEELIGRPYLERIHPDDRPTLQAQIERVLAGSLPMRFVFRVLRSDGDLRWLSLDAIAHPGADELVAVGRDVTSERTRAELEQQLIGIVSHDLRDPLSAIAMSSQALLLRDDLDPRTRTTAARIHSAVTRGVALVRDLLDFTRARRPGGIPISPQSLDVHAAVGKAVDDLRASAPGRVIEHEHAGDGGGRWDPARLEQLVHNLVSNALKYGAPDRPVRVRTLGGERWVRLEVWNAGEPIDPELIPHVFEPLRQASRTGGVGGVKGVGLGLYIVDHIVRAHGGSVDVVSTADAGTTFVVRLPREPPTVAEADGPSEAGLHQDGGGV